MSFNKYKYAALSHAWAFLSLYYMADSSGFGDLILPLLALATFSFIKQKQIVASRSVLATAIFLVVAIAILTANYTKASAALFGISKAALVLTLGLTVAIFMLIRFKNEPPILLPASSGLVLVAASMSPELKEVAVVSFVGSIALVLSIQESQGFTWSSGILAPLITTTAMASIFALTLKLSETHLSTLLYLFTVGPPSGIQFPTTSSLNSIQRWEASDVVVLRIYGKEAPPYLVGRTFSEFDKTNSWKWTATKKEILADASLSNPQGYPKLISSFYNNPKFTSLSAKPVQIEYPQPGSGYTLYAPRYFSKLAGDFASLNRYSDGSWQTDTINQFSGTYFLYPYPDGWISKDKPNPLSGEELEESLRLPQNLTPLVASIAQEVAGTYLKPEEKANRIISFFHNNFEYGYAYPFKSPETALDEFLAKRPPAHCEFFATATALMLRSQGIPTRYVNGFVVQEQSLDGSYYVVRLKHAHAWVEAYLPKKGWTTFDPTPPGNLGDPNQPNRTLKAFLEQASNAWRQFLSWFSLSPLELIVALKAKAARLLTSKNLSGLIALAALYSLWLWLKHRRKKLSLEAKKSSYSPAADSRLTPLFLELQSLISPPAWQRQPWETLSEWLGRLNTSNISPKRLDHLAGFLALYERERYKADKASSESHELVDELAKLKVELKGMYLESREPQPLS